MNTRHARVFQTRRSPRSPWIARGTALSFALGLLLWLWACLYPQVALAQGSPSGRGQVDLPGPLGVQVSVYNGNLSYSRTDLPFNCDSCSIPLDVYLIYNSNDAQVGGSMRFFGWRFPHDVYYRAEDNGAVTFFWSGGASVRFTPQEGGGFRSPSGVTDKLTSPQPGQYVLSTCANLTYYFDSPRHRRVTRVQALNGQALVLSYNGANQLTSIRDWYGRQILLSYDAGGYLAQVTDPNVTPQRTVQYSHDASGNLIAVTDVRGQVTAYLYDGEHRLTEIRDARGSRLRIVYDASGKVASLGTASSARSFSYGQEARQTTVVDMVSGSESQRTVYHYDDRGRLTQLERADGLSRSIAWDDDDNPVRVTDEAGQSTYYTFDGKGNVTGVTDPLDRKVTMAYHPTFNEMTSLTDPLGRVTLYEYDTHGNLVRVTEPGNRLTTYEYDDRGWHMTSMTDPLSRTVQYGYDQLGNNTVITDATGAVMTFSYDAIGRLLSFTDDSGHSTDYAYDAAGRVTSVTDPLSRATGFAYDAGGNPAQVTNAAGGIRTYRYDSLNRLLGITDEIGGGISYGYDGVGNTVSVADAHGHAVRYGYDVLDRLVSEADPAGHRTTFQYDAVGQLEQGQDADGRVSTFDYDVAGQVTAADYAQDNETYAYDAAGNVVAITSTQVIMRYAYNDADETTAVTMTVPGLGISKTIGYSYYADGSRASMTDPDGGVTAYTYDDRARIRTITNPAGEVVTYTWDGASRLTRKDLGNGTYVVYGYDDASQLLSMVHHKAGGDVLESLTYTYDDLGNRTSETRGDGRQVTYRYDARSRLIGASYSDGTAIEYAYDLAGHRTQMVVDGESIAYTVDAAGRLQSDGSATYGWDRQGNLTSVESVSGTITYTFDSRHRLAGVISGTEGTTVFDLYPDGRRLSRTDPGGAVTYYVYDGPNLLMELDAAGQTVARYTSGDMDDWLSLERGGQHYTYHADVLGSVVGLSDGSGNLVEGYRYSPFGRTEVVDGAGQPLAGSAVGNPFRFTGRQYLGLGELYDYRARIYDPGTGRFLSEDPAGAAWDPNRYAYALNNPATLVDPTGIAPAGRHMWVGSGSGISAGFLLGCKVWSGTVTSMTTGEQCRISEKCCSLGAQAEAKLESGLKMFTGPKRGRDLKKSGFGVQLGVDLDLGALSASAGLDINTETWESYTKVGLGAGIGPAGLSASGGQSSRGNLVADIGTKLGAGFSVAKGEYCKRSVLWCDKKEEDKEKEKEDEECDSDTGCCRVGPDCGSDEEGETECCFTCCDGPCDAPDCDPPPCESPPCDPPPPWDPPFPGLPPWGPGYDHPDENVSAASAQLQSSNPAVHREQGYVGLLWRGYARSAGAMINRAGERYEPVGLTFSPDLAQRLPVLVIPSGGLHGVENLASFKASLAAYVEQGGTIISFDQQAGADFGMLPAPAGGDRLGGYGWREDNSCFETALYISNYHPVVSGFDEPTLDTHVDGYFTTVPSGATELLNRMKNGQPGLVLYRYPAADRGGYVLATAIYDDWGATNFQGSRDALTLVRDMLSWAFDPAETLPEYGPGDAVSLPITVTNDTSQAAVSVEYQVVRPDRTTALTRTVALSVPAGGSAVPSLAWTLPVTPQLGIWWVDYVLRDANGFVVQERSVGRRLVVSDPSPITGPDRPLLLWITAPTEQFLRGSEGEFTFHVQNRTSAPRAVQIRYGLPHHTWETGDPSYGTFDQLQHDLVVGANDTATYVYRPTMLTTDRLFAKLYEGAAYRDNAHFKVWHVPASVRITPETNKAFYRAGEPVVITASLQNLGALLEADYTVEVRDPQGSLVFTEAFTRALPALGTSSVSVTYTLPLAPVWGYYAVLVQAYKDGLVAQGTTRFEVPSTRLSMHPVEPALYHPETGNDVAFVLESVGSLDISGGVFTATVHSPAGFQGWSDVRPFAVAQGQRITLTVPASFSNEFGAHRLVYQAAYDGQLAEDELAIPFGNTIQLGFDQARYCGGETIGVDVRVTNSGRFQETLSAVRLEVPAAGYSEEHALGSLAPGQTLTDTHFVPLPPTLGSGSYPLTATLRLASGSQEQGASTFTVPTSELAALAPATAEAGQVYTLTVTNVGCGVTSATYDLTVRKDAVVAAASGTVASLPAGEGQAVTPSLLPGATSGTYSVVGVFTDTQTGELLRLYEPVAVSGQSALLEAHTGQRFYLSSDSISAQATITSTGTPLLGSTLSQQVWMPVGEEQWITLVKGDHSPLVDFVRTIVIDGSGLKWFGTQENYLGGISVLDDNGTPLDKLDDTWQNFTSLDGLAGTRITGIAVDGAGRKWVGVYQAGVSVLDDGGTPFDKSDDAWETFSIGDGLASPNVQSLAIDGAGHKWFGTTSGVSVLDDGGTPFDKSDDLWQTFTTADGLGSNSVWRLAVDGSGHKWFGDYGVSVLDDGGTPLEKSDDHWATFTTADGLGNDFIRSITVDGQGHKWFGTSSGVSVLDDGGTPVDKNGDQWLTFTAGDGLGTGDVRSIAFDGTGGKWFATGGGGVSFLDDGGTPFLKSDDLWQTFTTADGLADQFVDAVVAEGANLVWSSGYQGVNVLDDGSTPLEKSDDQWAIFSTADGLPGNWIKEIAIDPANFKWFATGDGVSVLDDGGAIFDGTGDRFQSFTTDDGLAYNTVAAITVDGAGRKWFGSDEYSVGRVDVLDDGGTPFDKSDDTWGFFTTADGLGQTRVYDIDIDAAGRKWFVTLDGGVSVLDDKGTPFDKTGDEWQTFTTDDGLSYYVTLVMAIDDQGLKWIGTQGGGVSVLDDGGTPFDKGDDDWQVFTAAAGGLIANNVYAMAIDRMGYKWFAGGTGSSNGAVSVLDDGGTPFDESDDTWQRIFISEWPFNTTVYDMAIDGLGRKWFSTYHDVRMLDDAGTPFDDSDDTWQTFTTADGLAQGPVNTLALDEQDRKWFGTSNGVSVLGTAGQVLWEGTAPANPVGITQVISDVGPLNATGKLYLRAVLTSTTGQIVARDSYPFYVFDTQTVLTMETDARIYRPGQAINLSGEVRNDSGAPLTNQTLTIAQDGATIYTEGPFDVEAGGSHPFATTATAPGSPGSTRFAASVGGVSVEDEVNVARPRVEARLAGPDLAGSQPFSLTVVLTNSGQIEATVHVAIDGDSETVVLPVGELRLLQRTVQIEGDTTFSALFSGDLDQTLTHQVTFGEAAEAAFYPPPHACPGILEIPYVLTNTGQLEVEFTTQVSVTGSLTQPYELQIDTYLPLDGARQGFLALELAAGEFALGWQHPHGGGQRAFAVTDRDRLTLQALAGLSDGSQAPVTATLTNVGCNPFSGTLAVEAATAAGPFSSDEQAVSVALGGSAIYPFALNTAGLPPGVYTATLTLYDGGGAMVDTTTTTGGVPGPDLNVSALPLQSTLTASQTVTLTFGVDNLGAAGDQANLTFQLGDLEDETQKRWLDAGESGTFTYTLFLPPDLASGDYIATYVLTGTHDPEKDAGDLVFYVEGLSLTVEAQTDQTSYLEGEPATITLTIGNDGATDTGDLQALVTLNGFTQTQAFGLAPGASVALDFSLAASFAADSKVFYGVYDADSDRSIYLNTLYLRQQQPLVTVLTDKEVYQPGETVVGTLVTTLTQGTLDLFAPGYAGAQPITNGSQFSFALPAPLARGTYAIYYASSGTGTAEDGRERFSPFDVDGPKVFVHSAALGQAAYAPGDTVALELKLSSDQELEATLRSSILYPDRSAGQQYSQPVHLAGFLNNQLVATVILSGTQMGSHQLQYHLVQEGARGDVVLAEGSESFDVGPAALNRLTPDQDSYPGDADTVQARINVFSPRGGPSQVTLSLDEGPLTSQPVVLDAGCGTLVISLDGPIPPGRRVLTASLEMGGYVATAQTGFDYGTSLADLRPSAPWVAAGGTVTRTVTALVSNEGQSAAPATTVRLYDGSSPIGTAALPELEAGGQATVSIVWDILGAGGERTLRVTVDPVNEFDTGNNQAQATVTLPRLESGLSVPRPHIQAGEAATIGVWLENLQASGELPVTATVQIRSPLGVLVHEQAWSETLQGAEAKWLYASWPSGPEAELGTYSVVQEAWDAHGEVYLNRASFIVGPVEFWSIYLPLVVRDHAP